MIFFYQTMAEKKVDLDLGLGGLLKGFSGLLETIGRLAEKGEELKREGEIKLGKEVKGVYGFTIKTAVGGEPTFSTFGNIKKTPKGPVVKEEREPLVDVFDEKQEVRIIGEIPGVAEESIKTEIKGDVLTLEAHDTDRKYYKEIVLPKGIDPGTLKTRYKNGVVEIRISKKS